MAKTMENKDVIVIEPRSKFKYKEHIRDDGGIMWLIFHLSRDKFPFRWKRLLEHTKCGASKSEAEIQAKLKMIDMGINWPVEFRE
jgi:hypothetical protein